MNLLTIDIETREIPGFPGYFSSRLGRVLGRRGRELSAYRNASGYLVVKADQRHLPVHRAVALAWVGEPRGASDVNHIDGNKDNNCPENLEWCSRSENLRHSLSTGLHARPETPVIGVHRETGAGVWAKSQAEVKAFGFHQPLVNKCLRGERRHHRGYTWSYAA
jgi:hypothetical protein